MSALPDIVTLDLQGFTARSGKPFSDSTLCALMQKLPPLGPNGPWLAGGALRRLLMGLEHTSDVDLFFASVEQRDKWIASLPGDLTSVRETEHHQHFRGRLDGDLPRDVQAIHFRYYDSAADVIDSFDYTICQFAFDGSTLTTTPEALFDLGRKRLAVHRITYPVATMRRMLKYTQQGFTACAGSMAEILRQTAENPEALAAMGVEYVD